MKQRKEEGETESRDLSSWNSYWGGTRGGDEIEKGEETAIATVVGPLISSFSVVYFIITGSAHAAHKHKVKSQPNMATSLELENSRLAEVFCSFPVASGGGMSITSMIEENLVSSKRYESFVLTHCKLELMRSSAKLILDVCF